MTDNPVLLGTPWRNIADHSEIGVLVGRSNGGDLLIQVGFRPVGKLRAVPADEWEPIPPTARCRYCGEPRDLCEIQGDQWQCRACGRWWDAEETEA